MTTPSSRRSMLRFWTGTRPGLERLILASVPALIVGVFVARATNGYIGYLVGFTTIGAAVFWKPDFWKPDFWKRYFSKPSPNRSPSELPPDKPPDEPSEPPSYD